MIKPRIGILISLFIALFMLPILPAFTSPIEKSASQVPGILQEILISRSPDSLEVRILFRPWSFVRLFELSDPRKIVIDIPNIGEIKSSRRYYEVNFRGIRTVRAGMFSRNVARIVFDVQETEQPALYTIERMEEGVRVLFVQRQIPQVEKREPQIQTEKIPEEKPEVKPEIKEEKKVEEKPTPPEGEVKAEEPAAPASTEEEKLKKTKKVLDEELNLLNQIPLEEENEVKNFVRIEALGNYFQPRGSVFKDAYKSGMMVGAELDIGILNFLEVWLSEKNFSKKAIDEASGEERTVNLIPLEAGLKFRLTKGNINPYFGFGPGYYQYREKKFSEEIRHKKLGFIGLAGFFIKIGGYLVFDIYANYSYCLIPDDVASFNVGGLHFGLGFGFEY